MLRIIFGFKEIFLVSKITQVLGVASSKCWTCRLYQGFGTVMDRISGLPDEILCHTLSFLSTKEAASTSLLSKRWRNLFAFTPNLRFKDQDKYFAIGNPDLDISRSFSDFVDRALAVSGNSPVKKFSLKYRRHKVESAHVNLWICNVLSRGVLDHLHLDLIAKGRTSLPLQIFTCKTIVKLKLGKGFVIPMVPESASLPALKTLFLDCILFENNHHGCAFQALLSACHVLEELLIRAEDLEDWRWCRKVSSVTLQRLTIICNNYVAFGDRDFRSIIFDIPSLTYLDYADYVPDQYPIVSLDSLVEAKLDLGLRMFKDKSDPTNLIKGLRNVEILNLSPGATCEVFRSFSEAIPVFENLSRLSIKTYYGYWTCLPLLLEKSPNLQTLIIQGPGSHYIHHNFTGKEYSSGYAFLLSCPVKVLEITRFWGTIGEFGQIKRFLEKLQCLELLKVSAWARDEKAKLQLATDLLMLPRACKIQLEFFSAKQRNPEIRESPFLVA